MNEIETLEAGQLRLQVTLDVLEGLKQRGIYQIRQQSYRPEIPPNITSLDDNQLGNLLNQISIYAGFVEEEVAKAKAESDVAKARESFGRARVRIELRDSDRKLKPDDIRDRTETDKRIVGLVAITRYQTAIYDYAQAVQKSVQGDWDTVSRRITQRGQEIERFRREGNIGNQRNSEPGGYSSPFSHHQMRPG